MNLPDTIHLELKAKHFKGTYFYAGGRCAIEKALDELLYASSSEAVYSTDIDGINYEHAYYGRREFDEDASEANDHNYDDTIIRTLTLTKQ